MRKKDKSRGLARDLFVVSSGMCVLLILAEVKALGRVLAEGIAGELLVAIGAEVEAEVLAGGLDRARFDQPVFLIAKELADGFHVVVVEVLFGDLRGVVSGEDFHLHDKAAIVADRELLAANITRDM
jgi:hypothetical protein